VGDEMTTSAEVAAVVGSARLPAEMRAVAAGEGEEVVAVMRRRGRYSRRRLVPAVIGRRAVTAVDRTTGEAAVARVVARRTERTRRREDGEAEGRRKKIATRHLLAEMVPRRRRRAPTTKVPRRIQR
jgi:hypothetical protein